MPKGHPLACLDLDVICRHFWCAALRIAACVRLSTSEQLSAPSLQGQPQQGLARRQEQRGCGLQRSSALGSQVRRAGRGGGALACCAPQWGARSRSVVCMQAATCTPQSPQQGFNRLPHPTKRARLSPPPPTTTTHHPTHTPPHTHPTTHPPTHPPTHTQQQHHPHLQAATAGHAWRRARAAGAQVPPHKKWHSQLHRAK